MQHSSFVVLKRNLHLRSVYSRGWLVWMLVVPTTSNQADHCAALGVSDWSAWYNVICRSYLTFNTIFRILHADILSKIVSEVALFCYLFVVNGFVNTFALTFSDSCQSARASYITPNGKYDSLASCDSWRFAGGLCRHWTHTSGHAADWTDIALPYT